MDVAELYLTIRAGYGLGTGAIFLGKGAFNSLNGARVFWTGRNAAGVGSQAAAAEFAKATGKTML